MQPDSFRIALGVVGTGLSLSLQNVETAAAIAAGFATAAYMLTSTMIKIRNRNKS